MVKITDEVKDIVAKTKGFALATATKDGTPHVIPVGFGKIFSDDELLLVDVFMKKTPDNIKANPKVSVSVWDYDGLKGYEFKGNARIETSGSAFEESVKMVKSVFPQFDAKGAIVVKVDSIYVRSPGPEAGKLMT
ncbi:MAG: pyridoxamine 5'-phosphate oxidase family protein [Chloroflexota bacterium]|nr:pyridoxamine 5'-phosphate oxidase family protein [Chloroflexota bacterium]